MADTLKTHKKALNVLNGIMGQYDFNSEFLASLVHLESFHIRKAFHSLCSAYLRQLASDWIEGRLTGTEMEETGRNTYTMLYGEQ